MNTDFNSQTPARGTDSTPSGRWPLTACERRYPRFAMVAFALSLLLAGCTAPAEPAPDMQIELTLDPPQPVVGDAALSLRVTSDDGKPLENAKLKVEGNMNHAGMKPSFAEVTEQEPGVYAGTIDFTMGGDWFLLVTVSGPDGKVVERKIDVPGVRTK